MPELSQGVGILSVCVTKVIEAEESLGEYQLQASPEIRFMWVLIIMAECTVGNGSRERVEFAESKMPVQQERNSCYQLILNFPHEILIWGLVLMRDEVELMKGSYRFQFAKNVFKSSSKKRASDIPEQIH